MTVRSITILPEFDVIERPQNQSGRDYSQLASLIENKERQETDLKMVIFRTLC